ncbi:MAG: hypothetical protein M3680_14215 [Myxococcota bacterium]|nr:hypothetical protein [Myxococcota bacterium]
MATFQLFVGAPRGDAVLRDQERLARPDGAVDLDAEDAGALGLALDPYASHRSWADRALDALIAELSRTVAAWTQAAVDDALRSLQRTTVEPWMSAVIAARIADDARIAIARKVLTLADAAATGNGTLVYRGD